MRLLIAGSFLILCTSVRAQDQWKNIYSQPAWAARDKWQRADDLIGLLKISLGSHVADVGCHEGYMTFKLARVTGSQGAVYAVDVRADRLQKVRARAEENHLTQVKIVKGDYDNPKLPANTLDAVLILDAYHEMDDHDQILQHIKTALRKGGRLLLCEPIAEERRDLSRSEQAKKHEISMRYALADLKKSGFRILFHQDDYIDRTKEKGDKMWVVVATPE